MAILAQDLRIGNNLFNGIVTAITDKDVKVFDGYQSWWQSDLRKGFEPIELTEDILVKLGWQKETWDDAIWYEKIYPVIGQLCTSSKGDYIFDIDTDTLRITYLHELQNLIYSLTKKELNIQL